MRLLRRGSAPRRQKRGNLRLEKYLPTRTANILRRAGIETMEELAQVKYPDLVRIRGVGSSTIVTVARAVGDYQRNKARATPAGWESPKICPDGVEVEILALTEKDGVPWRFRDFAVKSGQKWERANAEALSTSEVIGWRPVKKQRR